MIIPASLDQKFTHYREYIHIIAGKVRETLQNYCNREGYAFASREKTIESLAEKIETGRYKCWSELDDLFACTIIVPISSHEDGVLKFCDQAFHVKKRRKRGDGEKSPDAFRFDSTRIYAQLFKPEGLEIAEAFSIYDILFEIQVKTAFEHAWSASTHDLAYKSRDIDWKRLRLASQIKATVEQLDTLILAFDTTLQHVSENPWPELKEKRDILDRMMHFKECQYIPSEYLPKDFSRFCSNLHTLLKKANFAGDMEGALDIIEGEIATASKLELFPRSVSLMQYFLAILVSKKVITPSTPTSDYYWNITGELLQLYPKLDEVSFRFDYELTDTL